MLFYLFHENLNLELGVQVSPPAMLTGRGRAKLKGRAYFKVNELI